MSSSAGCAGLFLLGLLVSGAAAQLSGDVGPTTTAECKQDTICNVLDYGGVASTDDDLGPAITAAFEACKSGGTVYVPPGSYGMSTFVSLSGGESWAFQLDGVIYRTGDTSSGNLIYIEKSTDFEFWSNTSQGAIQGNGYEFHQDGDTGPRLLRLSNVEDFSVHDIALVDSPLFHLFLESCTNGEVYNMIIRGGNEGGLDGLDVSGSNIWIHDLEVSNKDECVTIKNTAEYMLIENIYCNWSGGCAIGSLGTDTDIHHIRYENIYSVNSNQMLMIKSNGGNGSVYECSFENFIGHSNAYTLDIDSAWSSLDTQAGDGILFRDLNFTNWSGTTTDGDRRAPINAICPADVPCRGIVVEDFAVWTDSGDDILYKCNNAYGDGGCLESGSDDASATLATFTTTVTVTATPDGWDSAATMPSDLTTLGLSSTISIPPVPTTFFPGVTPYSSLAGGATASASAASNVER